MEQDLALLQNISETLNNKPEASQRLLAQNADISLGMMNAILGRFVERGWIMLKNVNGRKLAYAVTPEGIGELTKRSKAFARRTFKIANDYNDILYKIVSKAKLDGKKRVSLYGKSYIRFLLAYVCMTIGIEFAERDIDFEFESDSYCLVGELEENLIQENLINKGCISLLEILGR